MVCLSYYEGVVIGVYDKLPGCVSQPCDLQAQCVTTMLCALIAPAMANLARMAGVRKQGYNKEDTCWLKASPSLSRVRMCSVFLETAQNPSGHCSEAKPEA